MTELFDDPDFDAEEEENNEEEREEPVPQNNQRINFADFAGARIQRMRNNKNTQLLDSCGVEFEVEKILPGSLPRELYQFFSEEHDASVETPVRLSDNNSTFYFDVDQNIEVPTNERIIGTEYVSGILDINSKEDLSAIEKLCGFVYNQGEPEQGKRSGIHFHISMAYNQKILQNLIELSGFMEQIFYYIGGMGYEFRGLENDFTYCRPLTKRGPAVIHNSSKPFMCFNIDNLKEGSKRSPEVFFDAFGINYQSPPGKYNPSRYSWITFYNLITKGTLELRVCNKTLNPAYIINVLKFFRAFCESSLTNTIEELPINSIFDPHNKGKVLSDLEFLLGTYIRVPLNVSKTLYQIIERTPDMSPTNKLIYTHLKPDRYTQPTYRYFNLDYVDYGSVSNPHFIDVHTLGR